MSKGPTPVCERPSVAATPPEYENWPPFDSSWSTRTSNLGWLVPRFANAAPNGPAPSSGYGAPPTVAPSSRGSSMTGPGPSGAKTI